MRGFIKNSNFDESQTTDSDRRILNNLAGEGIVLDVGLFSNNLRNTSKINVNDYVFEDNQFKITNDFVVPFANNTLVKYNNVEYVVKNSNLVDSFQLFLPNSVSPFVPTAPFYDIIRNDSVLYENIIKLNPQRLQTKASGDSSVGARRDAFDPYTAVGINDSIELINQSTELYEYKRTQSIMTDRDSILNSPLTVDGTVTITNVDGNGNPIGGVVDNTQGPGLFIRSGDNAIRAFSDSTQPWVDDVLGELSTDSESVTIKTLTMTNPRIDGIQITELSSSETISISQQNVYSIPVEINGEVYYLLCKKVT